MIPLLLLAVSLLPSSSHAYQDYRNPSTGLVLERKIGDLTLIKVTDFEKRQRGLGVGASYQGKDQFRGDIFIYNLGLSNIPREMSTKVMVDQLRQAQGDIYTHEKKGTYRSVKRLDESSTFLGNPSLDVKALSAKFSYSLDGTERLSYLYLTSYKKHFIKIRISFPKKNQGKLKKTLSEFLNSIAKSLSGQR